MRQLSLQICRGLSLRETAWLAASLKLRLAPEGGDPDSPTALALRRGLEVTDPQKLGEAIISRISRAQSLGLERVEAGWHTQLRGRERARCIEVIAGGDCQGQSPAARAAHDWLVSTAANRFGSLDPRHVWEMRVGGTLEFASLRLVPSRDLDMLIHSLGLRCVAASIHGQPRRRIAETARRLGHPLDKELLTHVMEGAPDPSIARLAKFCLTALAPAKDHSPLEQLHSMGIAALACAGGARRDEALKGLAHTLSPRWGQLLMRCHRACPDKSAEFSDEAAILTLMTLQSISTKGLTQGNHHQRTTLVRPPKTRLSDEIRR